MGRTAAGQLADVRHGDHRPHVHVVGLKGVEPIGASRLKGSARRNGKARPKRRELRAPAPSAPRAPLWRATCVALTRTSQHRARSRGAHELSRVRRRHLPSTQGGALPAAPIISPPVAMTINFTSDGLPNADSTAYFHSQRITNPSDGGLSSRTPRQSPAAKQLLTRATARALPPCWRRTTGATGARVRAMQRAPPSAALTRACDAGRRPRACVSRTHSRGEKLRKYTAVLAWGRSAVAHGFRPNLLQSGLRLSMKAFRPSLPSSLP